MKTNHHGYFQFPLCLLRGVITNPSKGYSLIDGYAIIDFAKKINAEPQVVARQLMYDFYRNNEEMEGDLFSKLQSYIENGQVTYDEDYNGFAGETFQPDDSIDELVDIFRTNRDFYNKAKFHNQIHCACKALNVSIGSTYHTLSRYNEAEAIISTHTAKYGNDPYPGIKTSQLFDFRDKNNQEETDLFCLLVAIRSLIGQHKFTATCKPVLRMRIIGAKSNKVLSDFLKVKELRKLYNKYGNRYHMDKLIEKLVKRGFVNKISLYRQIYFSCELSMDELKMVILQKKKEADIRTKEAEARKFIQEQLKNNAPIPNMDISIIFVLIKRQSYGKNKSIQRQRMRRKAKNKI